MIAVPDETMEVEMDEDPNGPKALKTYVFTKKMATHNESWVIVETDNAEAQSYGFLDRQGMLWCQWHTFHRTVADLERWVTENIATYTFESYLNFEVEVVRL